MHAGGVSAAALICPGECRMSVVNWAMKSKYRACLGECLLGQARRVVVFYEVLEVFDGKLNSQQLTVESAVYHLGRWDTRCCLAAAAILHPPQHWRHP